LLSQILPMGVCTYLHDRYSKGCINDIIRNYVNATIAATKNLTYASRQSFILRADHTTVLDPNGPGRNSVRLESNKIWTNGVFVHVSLVFTLLQLI
jgi:hypothetical protein